MKIGFTGTRDGMTLAQWATVQERMIDLYALGDGHEWHDGDAIGADDKAHRTVEYLRSMRSSQYPTRTATQLIELHGHPCNIPKQRAYNDFDVLYEVKPPLVRNRDIVDAVQHMIAAPKEYDEVKRGSGTWATIRYARRHKRPLTICWPDGTKTEENQ